MKKQLAHVLRTRDENNGLHMSLMTRDAAHAFVRGSCVTKVRRGMMGERFVVLANGTTIVADMVTAKQLREWRNF